MDIISTDIYLPEGSHDVSAAAFRQANDLVRGRKLVALAENGPIPNPDQLAVHGAYWSYFGTWNSYAQEPYNSDAFLQDVYDHEYVITLDELPELASFGQ